MLYFIIEYIFTANPPPLAKCFSSCGHPPVHTTRVILENCNSTPLLQPTNCRGKNATRILESATQTRKETASWKRQPEGSAIRTAEESSKQRKEWSVSWMEGENAGQTQKESVNQSAEEKSASQMEEESAGQTQKGSASQTTEEESTSQTEEESAGQTEKKSANQTAEEESASRTEQESATQMEEESASRIEEGIEEESTSWMEEGMKESALDKAVSSNTLSRSKNPFLISSSKKNLLPIISSFSTAYKAPKSVSASKITDTSVTTISSSPAKEESGIWISAFDLYAHDKQVLESTRWVNDNIISAAQRLLRDQCKGVFWVE